ncbi:MAG: helix-turn-helix domain-containing protein [Acidobacteria bacterium]|nr:helix-turn-helix domain-containing protein [Acidobacteriota bacterium]
MSSSPGVVEQEVDVEIDVAAAEEREAAKQLRRDQGRRLRDAAAVAASRAAGAGALNIEQAAAAASIGRTFLYELLREGKGPKTFMLGRRRLITVEDLKSWITEQAAYGEDSDHPS